jgi:hypothetical protein
VFIPYTQPKDDQWRILIVDGHKSHTSVKFMEFCIKSKIYLVFLCSHILHVCQPNDLRSFSHLKRIYKRLLSDACTLLCESFPGKEEVFHAYSIARKQALSPMYITAGWATTGIWPRDRNKALENRWMTNEPKTSSKTLAQPVILLQPAPDFNEISSFIIITTFKGFRDIFNLYQTLYITNESFGKPVGRLAFRKLAKAFDLLNAELTESRFRCEALSEYLKKARSKKRKAIKMGVQDAFVQIMDVRKVKVSMGAIPGTFTPVPVAEGMEDEGDKSSIIENEIVVREFFSDSEFGSNYSIDR